MILAARQVIKEPLLHFLALGLGLFLFYGALNPGNAGDNPDRIVVDRDTLLTYLQYRLKAFDADRAGQQLDQLPAGQRQQLIDDYIREETLYREAKALQLDKNDNVARQRLVQQMRYLAQSMLEAGIRFTEDELRAYQQQYANRYLEPAKITFTHVFISTDQRADKEAKALAQQQLQQLNQQQVPFHQAPGFGERFLYHRNYVKKEADFIASHFGEVLQQAVFDLPVSDSQWHGPYRSAYGYHLVLVVQQSAEYQPDFEAVKNRVAQDLLQQRRQQQLEQAIGKMVEQYTVDIAADLGVDNAGDA